MYSGRPRRPRRQENKRTGLKNENIDRQILVLHRAMAEKIIQFPELVEKVEQKIQQRYEEGKLHYGGYLTWLSIIEHHNEPEIFLQSILEDSVRMRKLRRRTPFVGILTEEERQSVLMKFACGTTDIESLL